jgi:hypothetical protein
VIRRRAGLDGFRAHLDGLRANLDGLRTWAAAAAWLRVHGPGPRFLALGAFLFAGDLKADPRLARIPVDLTLLTGAVLCGVLVRRWLRGARVRGRGGPVLLGCWFLSFAPGLAGLAPTPYALQKVATIYTFSLLAALAPLFLVDTRADLERMGDALAGFCLLMTLGGLSGLGGEGADPQRLQAFGAGTIALGRATGFLFLWAALALGRRPPLDPCASRGGPEVRALPGPHVGGRGGTSRAQRAGSSPFRYLAPAVLALAGATALFAGSRGPILAALAVLVPLAGTGAWSGVRRVGLAGTAVLLAVVLAGSLSLAPAGSLRRVTAFFRGDYGASEAYRVQALQACWRLVPGAPWGLGWGGFATFVDPEHGVARQYPHNLLAEVTLEAGWLCGATTLVVLAAALAAAWSGTATPGGRLVFAGLGFHLCNALVSGDLNDNRPLFLFISCALMSRP